MNEIPHSKNVVTAPIDSEGNVIVGDGNTIINLKEAAQYKAIEAEIQELNERFERAKQKSIQYPDDPDFTVDLINIDGKRSERQKDLETLKQEVIKLAEDFARIPINTERLKKAKAHFERGEFAEARAVLDAEQMGADLNTAIQRENLGKGIQEQAKEDRKNLANEYLILARLTATDFELSDRFEKTVEYFEQSLRAKRNAAIIFEYARFLQEHKKYTRSEPLYLELLNFYRPLVSKNLQHVNANIASILNNLAIVHRLSHEFKKTEEEYNEALELYQLLAVQDPQTFVPYVAMTLNNLAILYYGQNNLEKAEEKFINALTIRKRLAIQDPMTFDPDVADTLNNLGLLHYKNNELAKAEDEYNEALKIQRVLVSQNSQLYGKHIAQTLNNLANLHIDKNELTKAENGLEEALMIRKSLAAQNPFSFEPDVAQTLHNLANLYFEKDELEKAEIRGIEALKIRRTLASQNPSFFNHDVARTLNNLAIIHRNKGDLEASETEYLEALKIYKSLTVENPQAFRPYVATILHNLATLHIAKNKLKKAVVEYGEALKIRKALAKQSPQAFEVDVANTAAAMAKLYQDNISNKEISLKYVKICIEAAIPYLEDLPRVKYYVGLALEVVKKWGLNVESFLEANWGEKETDE